MGPFSYIPFMECNHAILSMQSHIKGSININNNRINFNNGIGYTEKDWGCSFPKSYIWCQGNSFQNSNASFMLSIANIPFKLFSFRGIICVLIKGKMSKDIFESINSLITVTLKKESAIIFSDISTNCGLEIVH